jgi:hypothetical protein
MLAAAAAHYNWLGDVGGVLGVLGLIGAAVAVLKSSIATNTIKLLQQNNAALHEQNGQQAATIAEQDHRITLLEDQARRKDEDIARLEKLVYAKDEIEKLNGKVDGYHQAVLEAIGGRP